MLSTGFWKILPPPLRIAWWGWDKNKFYPMPLTTADYRISIFTTLYILSIGITDLHDFKYGGKSSQLVSWHMLLCLAINHLNAELNPTCHLLALLEAHHILHVSRLRVKYDRRKVKLHSHEVTWGNEFPAPTSKFNFVSCGFQTIHRNCSLNWLPVFTFHNLWRQR
jgi:hypothetical protein